MLAIFKRVRLLLGIQTNITWIRNALSEVFFDVLAVSIVLTALIVFVALIASIAAVIAAVTVVVVVVVIAVVIVAVVVVVIVAVVVAGDVAAVDISRFQMKYPIEKNPCMSCRGFFSKRLDIRDKLQYIG
jgi:hypothetical protein